MKGGKQGHKMSRHTSRTQEWGDTGEGGLKQIDGVTKLPW